jgi:hypothetical protein
VYDGPTTADVLLGEFTGTSLPGSITSSQGSMLLHFTSDQTIVSSGWSAEYSTGSLGTICFSEILTAENGYVDDNSGDKDYMVNADCQKLIMPEDVMNITLTFTEFVLEDGNDYVRVYDGPTTGDELLGIYTGTTLPGSLTSSGGSMLLHFTSNSTVNASGWAFSYTSIPETPDTTTITAIPDGTLQSGTENILVYPNPVRKHVTVEISNNSLISKIEVFDLYGRILKIKDNINSTSVTLQRGDLQTGVYMLRIHASDIHTEKIFVW